MAVFPCDLGQHRYAGPQQSVYLTVLENARDAVTVAARLCPAHFREVVVSLRDWMTNVEENGQMSLLCDVCGEPRETTVFARIYATRTDEECLAADVCASHRAQLTQTTAFREGRRLAAR